MVNSVKLLKRVKDKLKQIADEDIRNLPGSISSDPTIQSLNDELNHLVRIIDEHLKLIK